MPENADALEAPAQERRPGKVQEFFAVAAGGAAGALARWLLSEALSDRIRLHAPQVSPMAAEASAIVLINWMGAFALGALLAWLDHGKSRPLLRAFGAVGVLGAFTTFSAFALHQHALAFETGLLAMAGHAAATLLGGLLAFIAGEIAGQGWASRAER